MRANKTNKWGVPTITFVFWPKFALMKVLHMKARRREENPPIHSMVQFSSDECAAVNIQQFECRISTEYEDYGLLGCNGV
jgi:hypothetical protein